MSKVKQTGRASASVVRDIKTGKPVEDDAGERYSKNPEFIGAAFSLYCKGLSLGKICDALKIEWPTANERTLRRIAMENSWEKSRAAYLVMYTQAFASVEGLIPEIIVNLQKVRMALEGRLSYLTFAEINSYRGLCEDLLMYTGKHPSLKDSAPIAISDDVETNAFIQAIQDVLGGVWKAKRDAINKAYQLRLSELRGKAKAKANKGRQESARERCGDAGAPRSRR